SRLQYFVSLPRAVALRQEPLPHRFSEAVHQAVEIRIVERAGDRVSPKAPEVAHVPKGLEIAEMPGDANFRSRPADDTNPFPLAVDMHIVAPVRAMDFPFDKGNLTDH